MKKIIEFFKDLIDNFKKKKHLKKQIQQINEDDPFIYK